MDPLTDDILLSGFLEIHESVVNSCSLSKGDFVCDGIETFVRLHGICIDHNAAFPAMIV